MDAILASAPFESLLDLRGASRTMRVQSDGRLARHIILHTTDTLRDPEQLSDEVAVSVRSPWGKLPMFMGWSDHLEENLYGLPWMSEYDFDIGGLTAADWFEAPIPLALYPGEVGARLMRNYVVRAVRISDLIARDTQVIDLVGPVPLGRHREIFSALQDVRGMIVRFRPDVLGRSVWSTSLPAMTGGTYHTHTDATTGQAWDTINAHDIDTLVQFISIHRWDNVQALEEAVDSQCGAPLFGCVARRLVIHVRLERAQLAAGNCFNQHLGHRLYHEYTQTDVIVIFQYADEDPDPAVQQDNNYPLLAATILRPLLNKLADQQPASVTFVNVAQLPPQIVELSATATPEVIEFTFLEYFKDRLAADYRHGPRGYCPHRHLQDRRGDHPVRSLTLEEYAAEVGEWRFALETEGYVTDFTSPLTDVSSTVGGKWRWR
jgi:hypothetical protein